MKLLQNHKKYLKVKCIMLLLKKLMSSNDDKRIQPIDSIGTYAYETKKIYYVRKKNLNATIQ